MTFCQQIKHSSSVKLLKVLFGNVNYFQHFNRKYSWHTLALMQHKVLESVAAIGCSQLESTNESCFSSYMILFCVNVLFLSYS